MKAVFSHGEHCLQSKETCSFRSSIPLLFTITMKDLSDNPNCTPATLNL